MEDEANTDLEVIDPTEWIHDVFPSACELLALAMADKVVQTTAKESGLRGIASYYPEYRERRIMRLLLELASAYRITSWRLNDEKKARERAKQVGFLYHTTTDQGEPLNLHEACNKIVHAEEIGVEVGFQDDDKTHYTGSHILVSGQLRKKDWYAEIWIAEFCDGILTMETVDDLPW